MLSMSSSGAIFVAVYEVKQAMVGDGRYFVRAARWSYIATSFALALNLVVTGSIAGRLWYV